MTRPKQQPAACLVCGKPCLPHERNTDGSYAHDHCLASKQTRPALKEKT